MKNMRLQIKIFILYSIVMVIIIGGIFSFFFYYLSATLQERYIQNLEEITVKTGQQVENTLVEMDKIALYCITNPSINSFFAHSANLEQLSAEDKTILNQTMMSISLPVSASYIRTSLFSLSGKYVSMGIPDSQRSIEKRLHSQEFINWVNLLAKAPNRKNISQPHVDYWSNQAQNNMVSISRSLIDINNYKTIALVEVQLPYTRISSLLDIASMTGLKKLIYDNNSNVIYPIDEKDQTLLYKKNIDNIAKEKGYIYLNNSLSNEKEIVFFYKSKSTGWTLVFSKNLNEFLSPIFMIGNMFLFTGIILILIMSATIYVISQKLTQPLQALSNSVRSVTLDNLSLNIKNVSNINEVDELNLAFNSIFDKLKISMDEVMLAKSEELKAQLIALQSQMDPHFLYNMLSIISAISREKQAGEITLICQELASMLRYISVYNERSVSLQEELVHVNSFLKLMSIRFEDQLEYAIEVEDGLDTSAIQVPRLSLQPIVENCFQHGFKKVAPPWRIKLKIYYEDKHWIARISDNGSGIEASKKQELLEQVEAFIESPSSNIGNLCLGGMGLINTVVRLKLFYKSDMVFSIEKGEFEGTMVTIGGKNE